MPFLIVMGAMNPKPGEIVIINDNNDFPKGIRLISIFGKNMRYKHMPFCDTCCLLYISFFSIPSYRWQKIISGLNPSQGLLLLLRRSIPEKDQARYQIKNIYYLLFRTPWCHILIEKSKCHHVFLNNYITYFSRPQ